MSTADLATLREQLRDRYAIERELGRGGMGAVYLARELGLDRLVALKVLPPSVARDAGLRERFLRETRTAASFSHPNIVPVHAVEEQGDLLAFAMGYVEGESLAERVKRAGPLGAREAVRLMLDVAYALSYAHGRGVVHRDIKPDNIMIERATGRALVMDFGISRRIDAVPAGAGLTRVGEVVGTPEYMSPEQASGDDVDGRSDLYSLGLVAWFALTGETAMAGETTQKVLVKQLTEQLPPVGNRRPDVPAALSATVDRCVLKDPAARLANAAALVEALEAAQQAAPEIPVAVRLLAGELGGLLQVVFFAAFIVLILLTGANEVGFEHLDGVVPIIMLIAVMITRVVQTVAEVSRVMRGGYPVADLMRALQAVLDEAASLRLTRAGDPAVRERRRLTVRRAALQLVVAAALFGVVLLLRVPNGVGGYRIGIVPGIALFTGLSLLGVSLVLFARSPVRMPLSERVFRAVWLGSAGRMVFRSAARRAGLSSGVTLPNITHPDARTAALPRTDPAAPRLAAPGVIPLTPPITAPTVAPASALEARVRALEEWRDRLR